MIFHRYYKQTLHRNLLEKILTKNKGLLSGKIIDIGSKNRRYDSLFSHCQITAVDKNASPESNTLFADIEKETVFKDRAFDGALCLEVFEYLADPDQALAEIYRLLKPKGFLFLSLPFLYHDHGDKMRFTKKFISSKLNNFSNVKITSFGNAYTVIWDIIRKKLFAQRSSFSKKIIFVFLLPLLACLKLFRLDKIKDDYYSGIFIIAQK